MSRFFKRFGTKGVPYQIDIVLNKLLMNVIVPDCYVTVVLKRGDHKSEIKTAVALKDKVAKFEKQILSVPTKLYWDEKKQEFLSKIAEIQINIKHQKTVKSAGKIEFDAAQYATNDILSQKEQRPLQKCPDSSAKLFYEVRVHELGDYSHYTQQEEEEEGKPIQKQSSQSRARDVSPIPSFDNRNQIQDISQFHDRSVSPISRTDGKVSKQQFQQLPQDAPNSARGYNEDLQFKQSKDKWFRKLSNDNNKNLQPSFQSVQSTQQNSILKKNSIGEIQNSSETRNVFKQQKEENSTLKVKIQELIIENEDLKEQCDKYKNENQKMKSKISTLEGQQVFSTPTENSSKKLPQDIQSYETKIQKLTDEIKLLKNKAIKDKNGNQEDYDQQFTSVKYQSQSDDQILKFEREKGLWEKKFKDLEMSLQDQQQQNADQQSELGRRQKDIEYYKQQLASRNKNEGENDYSMGMQKQLQDLQNRNTSQESEFKKKLKELQEELSKLKREKEGESIDLKRAKAESDYQLAKFLRENEMLKKETKELTAKYQQSKVALQQYLAKEGTEMTTKSKEVFIKNEELNSKMIKMSVERGNIEMERDNLKREIRIKEEDSQKQKGQIGLLYRKLISTKQMSADIVNIIMMSGDRELVDLVEPHLEEISEEDVNINQQTRSNEIYKSNNSMDKQSSNGQFQSNSQNIL